MTTGVEVKKMRLAELLKIKQDFDVWIATKPPQELIEQTKGHLIILNERIAEEQAKIAHAETDSVLKAKIEFWKKEGRISDNDY